MNTFTRMIALSLLLIFGAADLQAQDFYFVDANSQFEQEVEGSFIIKRMGEGGVYDPELFGSGEYSEEVRREEDLWRNRGIQAVPSVIFNQRWMIQGGQPPLVFENAIRQILDGTAVHFLSNLL